MTVPITSRDNPLVRKVRLILSQSRRAPSDLVVVEGDHVLAEATRTRARLREVLLSPSFGRSKKQKDLLKTWADDKIVIHRVTNSLLKYLTGVVSPSGAVGVATVPRLNLEHVVLPPLPFVVCANGVADPGNLGTLIRTARAAGASFFFTTTGSVSVRNPKCVRATAGALFQLPVVESIGPTRLIAFARQRRIRILRTDPICGPSYLETDFKGPTIVLLGNETHGTDLSWDEFPSVRIPMFKGVESVNVAAAGAVLFFEAFRQRTAGSRSSRS